MDQSRRPPLILLRWRFWLFAIIFAGIVWRITDYLICFPVWGDETMLGLNILQQSYLHLTGPLLFNQVCPIGFLWLSKLMISALGPSPLVLRFIPLIAGICAVLLIWPVARNFANKRVSLLATAFVACSMQTVWYSINFKPYSLDLLTSVCLVGLGLWAIRKPHDWRPLFGLVLIGIPTILISFPSIFILASVGLCLLPQMICKTGWHQRILYCIFGILSTVAFGIIFFTIIRAQMKVNGPGMQQYWQEGFPPHNAGILWWLIQAHFSNMMSYLFGNRVAAFIITPLCLLGVWRLAVKRRFAVLFLLVGPFLLTFAAAFFHAYPYGYYGRVEQHLVPSIALLWAFGVLTLIVMLIKKSRSLRRGRTIISVLSVLYAYMAGFALMGVPMGFNHPYTSNGPNMLHDLMEKVFQNAGPKTQIVINENPFKYGPEIQWYLITQTHSYRMDGQFDATGLKAGGDLWVLDFGYSFNKNLKQQTLSAAQKMDLDLNEIDRMNNIMAYVGYLFKPPVCVQALHFATQTQLSNKELSPTKELFYGCETGTLEQVISAIKDDANVNAKDANDVTPLMWAAENNDVSVITELIKAGANVNARDKYGMTPLMWAAANANSKVVTTLIQAGAKVNTEDYSGLTALFYAVNINTNPDVIAALAKSGANVNIGDANGFTSLMYAILRNINPDVIATLVKAGADVNAQNNFGQTPLLLAAANNTNPEVFMVLIRAGADVNAKDGIGRTPLVNAILYNKNPLVIKALLNAGADINARDDKGETALDIAYQTKNAQTITELLKAGSQK